MAVDDCPIRHVPRPTTLSEEDSCTLPSVIGPSTSTHRLPCLSLPTYPVLQTYSALAIRSGHDSLECFYRKFGVA